MNLHFSIIALVDARDAKSYLAPETLRVTDETDKIARDIKVILLFEILKISFFSQSDSKLGYRSTWRDNARLSKRERLIFKHHLLHHFLER